MYDQYANNTNLCNTNVNGSIEWGAGNIGEDVMNHDPAFVDTDPASLDLSLTCPSSGSINVGSTDLCEITTGDPYGQLYPFDLFDADNDGDTMERLPDIDGKLRFRQRICMGAIESTGGPTLPSTDPCPADIAPSPCGNMKVDVDDLLAVVNAWGACDPSEDCLADIKGDSDGCLDHFIGVDDLLLVINSWGTCDETVADELTPWYRYCLFVCENADEGYDECVIDCLNAASDPDLIPEWIEHCVDTCDDDPDCLVECISNPPWLGWPP